MVTPPAPVPPPRHDARRFTIPTPADLRHPRERRTEDAEEAQAAAAPAEPADAGAAGAPAPPTPPAPTPAAPSTVAPAPEPAVAATTTATDRPAGPTPATLPRPGRPAGAPERTGSSVRPTGTLGPAPGGAHDTITQAAPAPGGGTAVEPAPAAAEPAQPGRRIFPNPATLMAAGRGARKARPGGLRARRLPKVEETSAGGVVLDLTSTPPAVALIARHDRRSRLLWSLPKGHVEEGETPEEAALREVFEETGLVGRIVAPLGVIDFWFVVEDKRIHKTVHHFVIEAIGGELSDEDLEVEAVEWIPFDQVVRKLAYGDERRLVEKVAQIVPGVR